MSFGIGSHIAAAGVAITVGLGVVLPAMDRGYPVTYLEREIVNREVPAGGELLVRTVIARNEVCATTVHTTIYDGAGIEVSYIEDNRPAFGPVTELEERTFAKAIPETAIPGDAIYRAVLSFSCNWTQDIVPLTMILPDLHFTITEPVNDL